MKKLVIVSLVLALAMIFSNASASDEWNTFSDNLVQALRSDNDGLKASAMQMIIKHEGKVWVHEAAYDVYQIFKDHENVKMRQLALVALYKMQNDWFLDSIRDDFDEETVISRVNARPAMSLLVSKKENADIIRTVDVKRC